MVEWSVRGTRNPKFQSSSPTLATSWIYFLVINWSASCQLGFLIVLCSIWIIYYLLLIIIIYKFIINNKDKPRFGVILAPLGSLSGDV